MRHLCKAKLALLLLQLKDFLQSHYIKLGVAAIFFFFKSVPDNLTKQAEQYT